MASTPPAAVKLSKSKLHMLQAQFAHCNAQVLSAAHSSASSTSPSSASPSLVSSLTTFLSNLLTLYTELAPHTTLPFDLVASHLLPGVYDLLVSSLQHAPLLDSPALPLLLRCVALFPLPVSSPPRLRLLCHVSGACVQRLVLDVAREQLDGVCMSAAVVTARISSLTASSLLLFTLYVRQLLQTTEGTGSPVLVLLLHCAHQLLAATDCAVETDELSVCLRHTPSLSALPAVTLQLMAHSDREAAYFALCEHKQWVDWALITLVLPPLYRRTAQLTSDAREQLLQLITFYHSPSLASSAAVHDWLDSLLAATTKHSTLSALFASLAGAGAGLLGSAAPSPALRVQLLLLFIPLYAPAKEEVSGYLSSLLSHFAPHMPLPLLLYHLLSNVTLFLTTQPHFAGAAAALAVEAAGGFVASVRSVSECWAYSLTCEASVSALQRQGAAQDEAHEKRIREYTRSVLGELRQLAVAGRAR